MRQPQPTFLLHSTIDLPRSDLSLSANPGDVPKDEMGNMESQRNLYSVADAAKQLERSTEQVRRYLREGRLAGRRMGGQWFIDRNALETFQKAAQIRNDFISKLRPAYELRALDNVIGIGEGPGSNISEGKSAYRRANSSLTSRR